MRWAHPNTKTWSRQYKKKNNYKPICLAIHIVEEVILKAPLACLKDKVSQYSYYSYKDLRTLSEFEIVLWKFRFGAWWKLTLWRMNFMVLIVCYDKFKLSWGCSLSMALWKSVSVPHEDDSSICGLGILGQIEFTTYGWPWLAFYHIH